MNEERDAYDEDRRVMEAEIEAYLDHRNYDEGGPPGGGCDPNYGMTADGGCVMDYSDFDCPELWDLGIGDIPVVGTDWMRLDGNQDFETGEWIAPPTVGVASGKTREGQGIESQSSPKLNHILSVHLTSKLTRKPSPIRWRLKQLSG